MAFKVGKQFVSVLERSKKFYRGIPCKSSLHLEREIEEKREREGSRIFKVELYHCSLFSTRTALFFLVNKCPLLSDIRF